MLGCIFEELIYRHLFLKVCKMKATKMKSKVRRSSYCVVEFSKKLNRLTFTLVLVCLVLVAVLPVVTLPFIPRAKAQNQLQPAVSLSPTSYNATQQGEEIQMNITITNVQSLFLWSGQLTWDPNYLKLIGTPSEGDFMPSFCNTLYIYTPTANASVGIFSDGALSYDVDISGSGVLASMQFQIIKPITQTFVTLSNITLLASGNPNSTTGTMHPIITSVSNVTQATVSYIPLAPPTADAGQNQTVLAGTTVFFDASKSVSAGENATYSWSFVDSAPITLQGETANYTFNNPGNFTITLIVTDSLGSGSSTTIITVIPIIPPTARIIISGFKQGQSITTGLTLTFDGSTSTDSNNQTVNEYLWDLGDGTGNLTTSRVTHAYSSPGTYTISLTVFDSNNISATTSSTIHVIQGTGQIQTQDPGLGVQPSGQPGGSNSISLPPAILAILIIITIISVGGSFIWLRKKA